jgi:hypothetical protein
VNGRIARIAKVVITVPKTIRTTYRFDWGT